MTIEPLGTRIVVVRDETKAITPGGLHIPDNARETPARGVVRAVGPGKSRRDGSRVPMDLAAGDRVLFGKYSGSEVVIDGETFILLDQSEVLAMVRP